VWVTVIFIKTKSNSLTRAATQIMELHGEVSVWWIYIEICEALIILSPGYIYVHPKFLNLVAHYNPRTFRNTISRGSLNWTFPIAICGNSLGSRINQHQQLYYSHGCIITLQAWNTVEYQQYWSYKHETSQQYYSHGCIITLQAWNTRV